MPYKNVEDRREAQRRHRNSNREKALEYLLYHPCVDCGESNPIVLEFDHVRGVKNFDVSRAITGSHRSWNLIFKEIEKCEVRCANCHRIRHADENSRMRFSQI